MLRVNFEARDLGALAALMNRFLSETASAPHITGDVHINVYDPGLMTPSLAGLTATEATATAPAEPAAPKKPGRPPKKQDVAPAAPPVQTDIEDAPAATYEDVVNALKDYMKMPEGEPRGMSGVIKFLKDNFGVEQTKALKPEQYAKAIELASAA